MAEDVRVVGLGETSGGGGTQAAPGSGVAIASVTPAAGTYRVTAIWTLTGTTETTLTNIRLKTRNSNLITGLPSITGTTITLTFEDIVADGTNPISICANAASTAGSVYTAAVLCTRIQ